MSTELELGMAIPRRISLLEESRNQGMAKYHSSGIEEGKIYSSGSSRNFEERKFSRLISDGIGSVYMKRF